jgi:hypothetical protein
MLNVRFARGAGTHFVAPEKAEKLGRAQKGSGRPYELPGF